jgi:hypothetical protein
MKPIQVGDCNNYSFDTNSCTKCGRAMPDLCLDFEEMKNKAELFDAQKAKKEEAITELIASNKTEVEEIATIAAYEAAAAELTVDPYVAKAVKRGRPPKK